MHQYVTTQTDNGRSHYLVADHQEVRTYYGPLPVYQTLCGRGLWGWKGSFLPEDAPSRPVCKLCLRRMEKRHK
ncbi:MAG: hypothetical protein GY801_14145 [bacterium]|nr:hypothetical protein [bacterium]